MISSDKTMVQGICEAIEREAARLKDVEIEKAVASFEAQLRERVALTAMKVADFYEYRHDQHNLVITVRHSPPIAPAEK